MADVALLASATQDAGGGYQVPGAQEIILKCLTASFDGSSAAGDFLPAVQIIAPNGAVMGTFTASKVTAGASADISWFPRAVSGTGGSGGSGIQFDTYPQTGDWLVVDTTGHSVHANGNSVYFSSAPRGYQFTSDDESGSGFSQFNVEVDGDNNSGINLVTTGSNNSSITITNSDTATPITLRTPNGAGIGLNNTGGDTGIGVTDFSTGGVNIGAFGGQGVSIKGTSGSLPLIGPLTGNSVTVQAGNSVNTSGSIAIGAVADGSAPLDTVALICLGGWEFGSPSPTPYAGIVLICALDNSISVDDGAGNTLMQILHSGQIQMAHLPSSNPGGSGLLWNNGGVVNIT